MTTRSLGTHPIHLGLGATATSEPAFTGEMGWYADYVARHGADGIEGRLVSLHTFTAPWNVWEMHPAGAEVVVCTRGTLTLHQAGPDGSTKSVRLTPGEYAINAPGVWHTADVTGEAQALFITAGVGTQHRPRAPGELTPPR
jgi:mannose-6-phosphate isomerase-like protein (cupin superfamily)